MKTCIQLTDADLVLARSLGDFVPAEIYDIHTHPWNAAHSPGAGYAWLEGHPLLGCNDHREAIGRIVPGRKIHGLYFGYPEPKADRAATNAWVADEVRRNGTPISRALALVSPQENPATTLALLRRERFAGIKVYHLYAEREDTFNAGLEEYAPEWMWEACHEIGGILMLHIVRDRAIADEGNLAAIRRLCLKYPKCRLVLAHVARSFNYRNGYEALRHLADLDNVALDMSGVTEADAMREAFRALGPRRVLYGSDYAVSELRGQGSDDPQDAGLRLPDVRAALRDARPLPREGGCDDILHGSSAGRDRGPKRFSTTGNRSRPPGSQRRLCPAGLSAIPQDCAASMRKITAVQTQLLARHCKPPLLNAAWMVGDRRL